MTDMDMYVLPLLYIVLVTYKRLKYRCTEGATLQGVCGVCLLLNSTKYFKGEKLYVICD
jgi:hypothetical protein